MVEKPQLAGVSFAVSLVAMCSRMSNDHMDLLLRGILHQVSSYAAVCVCVRKPTWNAMKTALRLASEQRAFGKTCHFGS